MYIATITGKSIQRAAKQYVVDVEFSNGTDTHTDTFNFGFDVPLNQAKKTIKSYIDRLEEAEAEIEKVTTGQVDFSTITEDTPTAAEIAKAEWFVDFNRLEQVERLNSLGAFPTAHTDKLDALRTKVANGFKPAYIADM